jgi:broad specificity phosphatase PhoE
MATLRRIVLVRHGETVGDSSLRFHGSSDVDLSEQGRAEMRRVAGRLGREPFDLVVASPLRRSWHSAQLAGRGAPVRLETSFREIHFGRWEGLTQEEIRARDPIVYQDWQSGADSFEFPGGESRSEFRGRVRAGMERLLGEPARSALLVLHKGVIRVLAEELAGEKLGDDELTVGSVIELTRKPDGTWYRGRRSSNPAGVESGIFA